ncbi:MAG: trigger factor [Actinomycetota bacterium]|nr:trigger factor [Actinomycetota bacterium]
MKTSVETLDGNAVKLTVTVPAEVVDSAITDAYKEISKKVKIPGFRSGRIPRPVIDNNVGKGYVLAEAQEGLVNMVYGDALDQAEVRPIASPEIGELDELVPGQEFTFEAEIEVRPEYKLSSLKDLSIEVPPSATTDAEVDAQIEYTRDRFATLELVDRGVEKGDFVLLSFVGKVDGEEYDGNAVDKYNYEMGMGMMPGEFDATLMGTKAGETAFSEFPIPDSSSNPEFIGKTATFDIEVHEVKAKVLPELDDEFAASVGGFDTFAEYRDDVRVKLEQSKAVGHSQSVERAVRAALAERIEGEAPAAMVDSAKQAMMRDFMTGLEQRGMTGDQYLQATGVTPDQIEADIAKQAKTSVLEELALEALFRELELEVTDEDLDEEIGKMADSSTSTAEELRAKWEETGVISVLHEQIMHSKAIMWLMDDENVEIIEKEPEIPGTSDSTEE